MSDFQSGTTGAVHHVTKKDRRRQQLQTKIQRLEQQFESDKDYHYRDALIQLQYKLSSLHSGDNPQYLQEVRDFEEKRDAELMRLRLAEEYEVQFINKQFKEDYDKAAQETEEIVQMVKRKLQDRIVKKICQLKEDKALIDIATSSSSTGHVGTRYHHPLSIAGNNGGIMRSESGYNSGFDSSSSFFFSSERRSRGHKRHEEGSGLVIQSNADDSYDSGTGTGTGHGSSGSRKRQKPSHGKSSSPVSDDASSKLILTDNAKLNVFLYGEEVLKRKEKASMRYSSKGYEGCPPLKPDEVNEDLLFLRNATGAIQSYKRGSR
ncbi:DEKNAAC104472 [Brettanomyces naardenensis]|uniref:DEKNAAC104472 n=1 Tax=Brettanomyces naardenensis TaxID=13370 RepID=A0A448YRI3_BRENA|nr:DEKNAAC104472 [Brettanomyces naardenensis]